jgi:hypothetical protein
MQQAAGGHLLPLAEKRFKDEIESNADLRLILEVSISLQIRSRRWIVL